MGRRAGPSPRVGESLEVSFVVEAGGGDDHVRLAPDAGETNGLFGGEGADVLEGRDGHDRLVGGSGRDRVLGGAGSDSLNGDGRNVDKEDARDAVPEADEIDGGPDDDFGRSEALGDIVLYTGRKTAVRVDLSDPAPGGAQDENDVLTGVESVAGGDGDDILIGDGEDNYLSGGPGRDVVEAGAGDDLVVEAEKADLGGGNDRLGSFVPATGVRASDVACGAGRDALSLASFVRLEAPAACEYAWFPGSPPLQVRFST